MTPIDKVEIIIKTMEEDYKKGLLPNYLTPYFQWRYSGSFRPTFTPEEAEAMCEKATDELEELYDKYPHAYFTAHKEDDDNPWQMKEGFGKDKRTVAYLEIVTDHLTDMRLADMWR